MDLPLNIYSVATVREIDRRAIEDHGIPGIDLMTNAGTAAFESMRRRWPDAKRWVVYCGAGNNAGDGYIVAAMALEAGLDVSVVALVDPNRLTGDASLAWQRFCDAGGVASPWHEAPPADLLVDALLLSVDG